MQELILAYGDVIVLTTQLVAAIGLLYFMWGLAVFIFRSGDPKSHEEGRNKMIWGLLTLFVMFSVWGLVSFVRQAVGVELYIPQPSLPGVQITPSKCPYNARLGRTVCL